MKAVKRSLLLLLCVAMLVAGALVMSACSKDCTEHAWGDWSVTTAATCIAEGTETRTCNECGETETRKIDKIAHSFSTYVPDGNATCIADGTKTATCTTAGCSAKDTVADTGSKKAHTFTTYTSNGDATCQKDGTKTATCDTEGCNATETVTDTGSKKSHSFTTYHSDNNATCQKDGTKTATCDYFGCNETDTVADTGSKKDHSFTDYVSNGDATCVLDGTKTATCDFDGCNETDTVEDEGSKLGHLWDGELSCENGHSCTRPGCDAEEAALGHDYRVVGGTELTCIQDSTTIYACQNGCGDSFTVTNQVALGHLVDEWTFDSESFIGNCTYELTYKGTCKNPGCGETVYKTETTERHALKSTIHTHATCSNPGQKLITCSECSDYQTYENYTNPEAHIWVVESVAGSVTTYKCSECNGTKTAITATDYNEATVDKGTLESAGEVELKDASIALDGDTLGGLEGNVSISADTLEGSDLDTVKGTLDQDKLDQIGDNPIYNFGLTDASGAVSSFNGWVTIRVPYTLEDGEDVDSIAVWFINDQGEVESIQATYDNGYAVFSTNHFSYYTVTRLTPAERCELYGHAYKVTTVEATCISDGYVLKVCQRCGNSTKEITGTATGHSITTTTVGATCTESGTATHSCANCDYERVEKIAPTGHAWEEGDKLDATCKNAGYTVYECSKCDASYKAVIAQKAHSYTDTVTKATCTTDGYTTRVCEWCEYTVITNRIAALGHDYKTSTVQNSCTTEGYTLHDCSRCDASYKTDIVPPSHTWDIEAPTCGKGQTCIVCGKGGQSATGNHTMVNGVCSVCGTGCKHSYNSVVTAPTCTEVGYTTNTCTVCGIVEKTDYKSATGHTGAPTCTVCGESTLSADFYTSVLESILDEQYTILIDSMLVGGGNSTDFYLVDSELFISIKGGISGYGTLNIKAYGAIATFRAIIEDGVLYVCGENTTALAGTKDVYAKIPLISLLSEADMPSSMSMIVSLAMNEDVLNWASDTLLPFLTNLTKDAEDEANLIARTVVELICDVTEVDGNVVITPSADKIKALNARLSTETIGEFIDAEFGTGTYDDIVDTVVALLETTVGEIIDAAAEDGADVIALVDSLDTLVSTIIGEDVTLSELMELEGSIQDMLKDDELRAMTVEDIVAMLMEGMSGPVAPSPMPNPDYNEPVVKPISEDEKVEIEDGSTTEEEIDISDKAAELLGQLKGATLYEIIGVEMETSEAVEYIDGMIDEIFADLSVSITADKSGKLISLDVKYAEFCDLSIVADYVSEIDYTEIKANVEKNTDLKADKDSLSGTYEDGEYEFEVDASGKIVSVWFTDSDKDESLYQSEIDDNGNRTEIFVVYSHNSEYYADLTNALIATHSDCKNWVGVAMMAPGTRTYTSKTYVEVRVNGEVTQIIDDPEILEMLGIGSKDEGSATESDMVEVELFIDSVTGEIIFGDSETRHNYEEDEAKHKPAVGCEGVGEYHYFCTECGETVVVPYTNGHDYKWTYELKPGATSCEDGIIGTYACTVCGKVRNTHETDYHETEWEKIDFTGYGVCEHHYFEKYSCPCGQRSGFSYGNGFDWMDDYAYCPTCGVTVKEDCTYTPGEGCMMNEVRVILVTKDGQTLYSETISLTHEAHDTRREVTLMPGSITCEDGIIVRWVCSKCGKVESEYEEYYHCEYEKVIVDFADYGSVCGGYLYTNGCACGYSEDKNWVGRSCNCEFEETDVYYNEWRDYCYKYTCAVTSPACGFTYYERNRLVESKCGYTVYRDYYIIENGNEVILYSYVYEEEIYHNYEESSEDKTPVEEFPCLYLVSRVESCTNCGHDNVFKGYEFQHSYTDHEDGYYCDVCGEGEHYEYDDQGRTVRVTEIYWYTNEDHIQKNYCERRWMYYKDYQFRTYEYTAYEYYYNRDGKWQLEDPYWYSNTYEYDFSGECTVTRTYEDSYGKENYSTTYCACEHFTYSSATDATCTQHGVGTKTCLVCGTTSSYEIEPICHEWIWYDIDGGYVCRICGLKNANGASGQIVLEDASDLDGDDDTYIVGYYYRDFGDKFEIIYAITLITADGEEIYIDLEANGIAIMPWGDGRYITFSKSAVMAVAANMGYPEGQYDIRISFVPVGWESDLDYAVTFEIMSATDECEHYYYDDVCVFCGARYENGGNVEDGNCKHYYENGYCIYCKAPEDGYTEECQHYDILTDAVDATCTEGGHYIEMCKNCGVILKENYTPAFGHNFVDGSCTMCGAIDGSGEDTEEKEILFTYAGELNVDFYSDYTTYYTGVIYTEDGMAIEVNGESGWDWYTDSAIITYIEDTEYLFIITENGELELSDGTDEKRAVCAYFADELNIEFFSDFTTYYTCTVYTDDGMAVTVEGESGWDWYMDGMLITNVEGNDYIFIITETGDLEIYENTEEEPGEEVCAHEFVDGWCIWCKAPQEDNIGDIEVVECEHAELHSESIAATCTSDGVIREVCVNCGTVISEEYTPALGHEYADDGSCTICGEKVVIDEVVDAA